MVPARENRGRSEHRRGEPEHGHRPGAAECRVLEFLFSNDEPERLEQRPAVASRRGRAGAAGRSRVRAEARQMRRPRRGSHAPLMVLGGGAPRRYAAGASSALCNSSATCRDCSASSGSSGERTGPPHTPRPTRSIAALIPDTPSSATIFALSTVSRSCAATAALVSPDRIESSTSSDSAVAKSDTARIPPLAPVANACWKMPAFPVRTEKRGDWLARYDANSSLLPELSFIPSTFGCCASSATTEAGIEKCMYLGMLYSSTGILDSSAMRR